MPIAHALTADHSPLTGDRSPLTAERSPFTAHHSPFAHGSSALPSVPLMGPVRPDRMTVWPTDDGRFGIDVRWRGRECILRSVVVRRLLTDAGYATSSGNSSDGRVWEVKVTGVPPEEVASLIRDHIW